MSERKVRILCLHGGGSSNEIMKMQIAAIRYEMENEATFDFIEGAYPSPSGDALAGNLTGVRLDEVVASSEQSFYAYYDPRNAESLQGVQDEMLEYLSEEQFDAVIAFSEGAALASSLMIRHAAENLTAMPLFPCAIFLSGIPPLRVADAGLRRCQRDLDGVLIYEPTLHVIGDADPWKPSNEILLGLCESKSAICIRHSGGHEVPRSPKALTDQIVQGIRDSVAKSRLRQ
ncbi:hypothetical protein ACHAPE_010223 [Trichoderma viride]